MKTKAEIVGKTDFNKERTNSSGPHPRVGVRCGVERQPSGAAARQAGRTTTHTTTARRPTGVVVLSSKAVRVPPKKVELFIEKRKSWCCMSWKKTKMIGSFGFDKQPREELLPLPVWTSIRSTLDVDRVLRHQDYTNVRITVHLRGGFPVNFSTSVDWLINEMKADEFVLRLNGKYMPIPREMAPVKVTAIRPQRQETVKVDADSGCIDTEKDEVKEQVGHNYEGVRSDGHTEETEEEKVVTKKDTLEDEEGEEERWRNVVVVGGPSKGQAYQGVGPMWPDTTASTDQVQDSFGEKVIMVVRRVVAAIMVLCVVAIIVDAVWDEDDFQ